MPDTNENQHQTRQQQRQQLQRAQQQRIQEPGGIGGFDALELRGAMMTAPYDVQQHTPIAVCNLLEVDHFRASSLIANSVARK